MDIPSLLRDLESLERVRTDSSGYIPESLPDAVVRATSIDDVVATLQYASSKGIPVVTRGAGSGLSEGSSASAGEIVLDLSSMNKILELDPQEQIAVVEAGVMNSEVTVCSTHRTPPA